MNDRLLLSSSYDVSNCVVPPFFYLFFLMGKINLFVAKLRLSCFSSWGYSRTQFVQCSSV